MLQGRDFDDHASDFGCQSIQLRLRQANAARLLQDQTDVWVDEGADKVALGRLINRAELLTVHHTSQGLLVVLANVRRWRLLLILLVKLDLSWLLNLLSWHWHLRSLWNLSSALSLGLVHHRPPLVVALISILVILAARRVRTSSWRRLLVLLLMSDSLIELLPLAIFRELGEQLEKCQKELSLLRAKIIAKLFKLVHVFLHFLTLLVTLKLDLIDSLQHVSFALLSRLKLADVKRTATEGTF